MKLDPADRRILLVLRENARMSITDLAEQTTLSVSACHRRLRSLEESGLISGYQTLLNGQKLGYAQEIFVELSLHSQSQETMDLFEKAIQTHPEILECHLMAGSADYILRIVARDIADYERIHREVLSALPGVFRVQSNFVLRSPVKRRSFPLPGA